MNRRQSLDKPGILSPSGPFLTPSPSPSIPASPRLQPSPSLSPFPQDVVLVTNSNINNTTQDQERKVTTPNRRPSFHQLSNSPNAGTVVYRPSPTQSPVAIITTTGNELNTTLVGSNNISLNKKSGKRIQGQPNHVVPSSGYSPKAAATTSKKIIQMTASSPISSPSPIASPNSTTQMRPPTPQPIIQHFPVMNTGNQLVQIFHGAPQLLQQTQQRPQLIQQTTNAIVHHGATTMGSKHTKGPQQILPKPSITSTHNSTNQIPITSKSQNVQSTMKSTASSMPITISQNHHIVSTATSITAAIQQQQTTQHQHQQHQANVTATPSGSILLPTGNLNAQPLALLNQMPVIVQQNTPQGVQLILRQPAPQLAAPSLLIHNTRPQTIQQQPQQQLLRILNTNGAMQLATTPTFIVSSQANLIQQNLQNIKSNTTQLAQLGGLQAQRPQLTATLNNTILGQNVAQIQNLQINGNIHQIQMPNGLNGQFLSQIPAQFQQSLAGFNQINQNINLNQMSGTNIQQLATAATASFQTANSNQTNEMLPMISTQNIQFTTTTPVANQASVSGALNVTNMTSSSGASTITISPMTTSQSNMIPITSTAVTTDTSRLSAPITLPPNTVIINDNINGIHQNANQASQQSIAVQSTTKSSPVEQKPPPPPPSTQTVATTKPAKKPKKPRAKKQQQTSTGKLDLANVMKLCGIGMEDDDFMDMDDPNAGLMNAPPAPQPGTGQSGHEESEQSSATTTNNQNSGDIMVTIPYSGQNTEIPITFTIPSNSIESHKHPSEANNKVNSESQFMIKIDASNSTNGQPYTISIPQKMEDKAKPVSGSNICVPTFVNNALNATVTPTLQSQINEIQNQLMGVSSNVPTTMGSTSNVSVAPTVEVPKPAATTTSKKKSTKKPTAAQKRQEAAMTTVPSQIGNIQISQIDSKGNKTISTAVPSKPTPIENQIQITPIIETVRNQANLQTVNQQMISQTNLLNQNIQSQSQIAINVGQNQILNNNLQILGTNASQQQGNNIIVTSNMNHLQNAGIVSAQAQQSTHQQQSAVINAMHMMQQPQTVGIPQLTGGLSLSFTEDGRLLLIHNANAPQDAQSQTILQAVLSGALCNVTLVNDPGPIGQVPKIVDNKLIAKSPMNVIQKMNDNKQHSTNHQTVILNSSGQAHTIDGNTVLAAHHSIQQQNSTIHIPQQSVETVVQPQQTIGFSLPQKTEGIVRKETLLINPNASKLIELPKIGPDQQLFTLNTLNNQITQLNPGLTTAAMGPMERLLIVPAGINAQQLFQCLVQGQIHFNNVGQASQAQSQPTMTSTSVNSSQPSVAQQKTTGTVNIIVDNKNDVNQKTKPTIETKTTKKSKAKKGKESVMEKPTTSVAPMQKVNVPVAQNQKKPATVKVYQQPQIVKSMPISITPQMTLGLSSQAAILKPSQTNNVAVQSNNIQVTPKMVALNKIVARPTMVPVNSTTTTKSKANVVKISPSVITTTASNQKGKNSNARQTIGNNQVIKHQVVGNASVIRQDVKNIHNLPKMVPISGTSSLTPVQTTMAQHGPVTGNSTIVNMPHPPMQRVQTIQLTPQKQQLLQTVQMHIQTFSSKLQNKSLLGTLTIPPDIDLTAVGQKPLPSLNNLSKMSDVEITQALQQLFIEQQRILATGKVIPTLPGGYATVAVATMPHSHSVAQNSQVNANVQQNVSPTTTPQLSNNVNKIKKELFVHPIATIAATTPSATTSMQSIVPIPKTTITETTTAITNSIMSPKLSNSTETVSSSKVNETNSIADLDADSPKVKLPRHSLFEHQLSVDRDSCLNPDYLTPFTNKEDAIKRLIRYHCLYENCDEKETYEDEMKYEEIVNKYQSQFSGMLRKYQLLIMKESMLPVRTSEFVMLGHMFVDEIKKEIVDMTVQASVPVEEVVPKPVDQFDMLKLQSVNNVNHNNSQQSVNKSQYSTQQQSTSGSQATEFAKDSYNVDDLWNDNSNFDNQFDECVKHKIKYELEFGESDIKFDTSDKPLSDDLVFTSKTSFQLTSNKYCVQNNTLNDQNTNSVANRTSPQSFGNTNSSVNICEPKQEPSSSYDIENEIVPAIIKKTESMTGVPSSSSMSDANTANSPNDFNLDYFQSNQNSLAHDSLFSKKSMDNSNCDQYDEWTCIQRELSLITEKRQEDQQNILNDDGTEKISKPFVDIFNQTSPKSVESQLNDLFNHTNQHSKDAMVRSHSPLSELFNSETMNNDADKSVENHLEAMFGESSELSKTNDLVESRLEALFNNTSEDSAQPQLSLNEADFMMINHHSSDQMFHQHDNTNKRQWLANGDFTESPSSSSILYQEQTTSVSTKRSCMMTQYIEDNRWLMDCQDQQQQDQHHSFDFNLSSPDLIGGGTKRQWNGEMMMSNNSNDHLPPDNKKICYNHVDSKSNDMVPDIYQFTHNLHSDLEQSLNNALNHQLQQQSVEPQNNMFHNLGSMSGNLFSSNTGNSMQNNSMVSSFDEDINRHVQNAIDSILNLQNNEGELQFPLDGSIGFLADSPLGHATTSNIIGSDQMRNDIHPMVKRRGNSNQLDDINDCFIDNESSLQLMDSQSSDSPIVAPNSGSLSDYGLQSGIDDAVKSIITS